MARVRQDKPASDDQGAKNDGANVQLAWEALRRGREAGHRWMNWGGATHFKKDLGGARVEISCWLGGAMSLRERVTAAMAHEQRALQCQRQPLLAERTTRFRADFP